MDTGVEDGASTGSKIVTPVGADITGFVVAAFVDDEVGAIVLSPVADVDTFGSVTAFLVTLVDVAVDGICVDICFVVGINPMVGAGSDVTIAGKVVGAAP